MIAEKFGWLISELRLLKNKYKYLESVTGTYEPMHFCYIVYFNCNFCGEIITIPVFIADDLFIDRYILEKVVTEFTSYYSAYEKYFT